LIGAYKKLFDIYNQLGEETDSNNFDIDCKNSEFITEYKIINPLVFWYYNNKSKFGFHKHDLRNQKFQLLLNLTQPGIDYIEGETLIYMGEGRPDLNSQNITEECCIFGSEFEAGDIFSFPYGLWHRVNMPKSIVSKANSTEGCDARVSLLMPLARRNAVGYSNEVI